MATRLKMRNDTAANWLAANPVLAKGELGFLIENGQASDFKIGDGLTVFTSLPYKLSNSGTIVTLENLTNGFFKLTVGANPAIYFPATTILPV